MSLSSREVGCVVITGSTKGIGLALAHAFFRSGMFSCHRWTKRGAS